MINVAVNQVEQAGSAAQFDITLLSGFLTDNYVNNSQTGGFYAATNPSGFITGIDTANFYTNDNPSGFITGGAVDRLQNGEFQVVLAPDANLYLATGGGIIFDRNYTSINVGMGFHIRSAEGISIEPVDSQDSQNILSRGWYFNPDGTLQADANTHYARCAIQSFTNVPAEDSYFVLTTPDGRDHSFAYDYDGIVGSADYNIRIDPNDSLSGIRTATINTLISSNLFGNVYYSSDSDLIWIYQQAPGVSGNRPCKYNGIINGVTDFFGGQDNRIMFSDGSVQSTAFLGEYFTSGIKIGNDSSVYITKNSIYASNNSGVLTDGLRGVQYSGYFDNDPAWFSTASVKPIINEIILSGSSENEFNGTYTRANYGQTAEGVAYYQGDNGNTIYYYSTIPSVESYWYLNTPNTDSKFISYNLETWIQNPAGPSGSVPPTTTITQTQNFENSTNFGASRALSNGTSWQWVGYFKANHTSSHNFYINADENAYFWIGDKAVNGYTTGNADMYSTANNGASIINLSLTSGIDYPVRIQWGHPENPTNLGLSLSYRNGIHGSTNDFSGVFFNGSLEEKSFYIDAISGNAFFAGNIQSNTATFNNLPTVSGNALLTSLDLAPYALSADTGIFITTEQTGAFYGANNPSGFITGVDTANFYTNDNPSGFITGVDLAAYALNANTGSFVTTAQTGAFYAASNPSGYITGVNLSAYALNANTGSFVTTAQTGAFYAASNPSGYITGVNLSAYALNANTGSFVTTAQTGALYAATNPSGYIAGDASVIRMVAIGQSAYNLLTPSPTTFYIITGA